MENNNGRGVFYGVIGVATLVVAIIGATFAYFSAQVNTETNAIRAESAIIQLNIATETSHTNLGSEMIPVEADGETAKTAEADKTLAAEYATLFPRFPSAGTTDGDDASRVACEDLLGNRICSIYTFTVSNPSTATQKIYGFLTVQDNTFSNLKYAVFKGTPTDVAGTLTGNITDGVVATGKGWNVLGTVADPDSNGNYTTIANGQLVKAMTAVPTEAVTTASTANAQSYIPGMTVTLTPNDNADGTGTDQVTYTVLLWIEETGSDQTTGDSFEEAGTPKAFNGGILVNTSGGGDGVTASLKLAA